MGKKKMEIILKKSNKYASNVTVEEENKLELGIKDKNKKKTDKCITFEKMMCKYIQERINISSESCCIVRKFVEAISIILNDIGDVFRLDYFYESINDNEFVNLVLDKLVKELYNTSKYTMFGFFTNEVVLNEKYHDINECNKLLLLIVKDVKKEKIGNSKDSISKCLHFSS